MSVPAKQRATYEDLFDIPENMTGEILDGSLVVTPRPSKRHTFAGSALTQLIGPPFQLGEGGAPGGWIFIVEPEVGLGEHILVPDLAGWRRERFPFAEETNWISVAPDWVCEVLSPGTARRDKTQKMPLYAQ
ncbi:MAG: Uma2 family endonuclease [Syntrophobacteraceae bacterium]